MSGETGPIRETLDALAKLGVWAMRVNSGKVKVRGGWVQLAPDGTADIIGRYRDVVQVPCAGTGPLGPWRNRGTMFGVEFKIANARTKKSRAEAQAAWGAALVRDGGVYVAGAITCEDALRGLGLTDGT